MNDLGLGWEDEEQRPRHRHRGSRPARKKKKGRGGLTFLAFFIGLLVVGGLAYGVYAGVDKVKGIFDAPDYNGDGNGEVTVEVISGQLAADIGQTLQEKGVVKSAKAFVAA